MRYRTKLYLSLLCISFITITFALSVVYTRSKAQFLKEYSSKVLSIAETTALFIDGDKLKAIQTKADENSPEYQEIHEILKKARDANRREDVYIKWLYIYRPSPQDPEIFQYVIDTEENPKDHALPGDIYEEAEIYDLPENFRIAYAPRKFIQDPTGRWLIASIPIRDSKGEIVAALEADIKADDVIVQLNKLLMFGFWALLLSCSLAVIIGYFLAKGVTQSLHALVLGVKKIEEGDLSARVSLKTHDEFNDLALAINDMAKGLQERERLKTGFARYVSQHVMDKILHSETSLRLEGERRKITVLFSDIRHFTSLSEKLPPEEVVGILNSYFEKMIEVIFRNHGTLDKFLGDGLMVEFGAPLEDPRQEINAVTTALEMHHELRLLSEEWEKGGRPGMEMGIGIHTGFAVVGNIGSERRIEYTAVGDTVNVAARLEFTTKSLKMPILISQATFSALPPNLFKFRDLGPMQMHGRTGEIEVYAILPFD
jgi:adenylate cyclase